MKAPHSLFHVARLELSDSNPQPPIVSTILFESSAIYPTAHFRFRSRGFSRVHLVFYTVVEKEEGEEENEEEAKDK